MIPGRDPSVGRNQFILDLTKEEVREYLYTALSQVFTLGKVDYIKWDMNRTFSDIYSNNKAIRNMGEFNHRYILGLYALLNRLIKTFPKILFESCASGGNRFDLGMLCFMPQNWVSDDTDAYERIAIQEGTACGYPLSAMGCHVSATPNHQTLRKSDIETRFNVAAFGNLGYELDMTKLNDFERAIIKDQIAFYKLHRNIFQYGTYVRLPSDKNTTRWAVMDPQKANILILDYKHRLIPNSGLEVFKVPIAHSSYTYEVYPRQQRFSIKDFGSLAENFIADSTGIENKKLKKEGKATKKTFTWNGNKYLTK
jgi:alpha-galactosidase